MRNNRRQFLRQTFGVVAGLAVLPVVAVSGFRKLDRISDIRSEGMSWEEYKKPEILTECYDMETNIQSIWDRNGKLLQLKKLQQCPYVVFGVDMGNMKVIQRKFYASPSQFS